MSSLKKHPVAVQLYSVREEIKKNGCAEVLKKIAEMGYDAVEFAGFYGQKPKDIKKTLDDLGLKASSSHGAMPNKDNIAQIVDDAKELGYKWHITGLGPEAFADETACKKSADILREGTLALKGEGLMLGYHNLWWEYEKQINGKYPIQIVMDSVPDIYAQIDTYWVAVGGANVPEVIRKVKNIAPVPHIKDGPIKRGEPHTAVGAGKMNWNPIMAALNEKKINWLVVELDLCATDMLAAVKKSFDYLVNSGFGQPRTGKL